MTKPILPDLETILDIKIERTSLFETALTHRSYLNEHAKQSLESNERLEFLGDAVLQLLSSDYLYTTYPELAEGTLTNLRASIVKTQSLAYESQRLGFGDFLLLSKGEEATGGRNREYILANTFEAVLGAIYLQNGIELCREYLHKNLFYKIPDIIEKEKHLDAKSLLQEKAQEKLDETPYYETVESWGMDHDKTFRVVVKIGQKTYGEGVGKSKQKAETEAANDALKKL